jgi:uncharacterized membrane protein
MKNCNVNCALINIVSLVIASLTFLICLIGHHDDAQFIPITIIFPIFFIIVIKKSKINEKSHLFLSITSISYLLGVLLLLVVCILEVQNIDIESKFNENIYYGVTIILAIIILLTAVIYDKKRNKR